MSIQLAPDVEAELRAEAAARGLSVDALVAVAVDSYLANSSASRGARFALAHDRSAEMAWAEKPNPECRGKWVVLEGSSVVAAGTNPSEIYEQARGKGLSSPFLIYIPTEESEDFAGGWLD
jgi:hypothetical protein